MKINKLLGLPSPTFTDSFKFPLSNEVEKRTSLSPHRLKSKSGAGFTLIELLVVVAIIGILASVVMVSLGSARVKARDAKRTSEMYNLRTALELYNASYGKYPTSAEFLSTGAESATVRNLAPKFIARVPTDPLDSSNYYYSGLTVPPDITKCLSYHLGTKLEADAKILESKAGKVAVTVPSATASGVCTGGGTDFDGTVATAPLVYDLAP